MKQETEIEKIKRIMGTPEGNDVQDLSIYDVEEKIRAIINFRRNTQVELNLDFVYSVQGFYESTGRVTVKQERAIENIIKKFNINMEMWA